MWSGRGGETNFFYQFTTEQRNGYAQPDPFLWNLMQARNDPRRAVYYDGAVDPDAGTQVDFGTVDDPTYPQQIFSADENTLIWAEAAYRTGNQLEALAQLNRYAPPRYRERGEVCAALLRNLLRNTRAVRHTQAWTEYRESVPDLTPTFRRKIPGRLFYDAWNGRPPELPSAQTSRLQRSDPANATDYFGTYAWGSSIGRRCRPSHSANRVRAILLDLFPAGGIKMKTFCQRAFLCGCYSYRTPVSDVALMAPACGAYGGGLAAERIGGAARDDAGRRPHRSPSRRSSSPCCSHASERVEETCTARLHVPLSSGSRFQWKVFRANTVLFSPGSSRGPLVKTVSMMECIRSPERRGRSVRTIADCGVSANPQPYVFPTRDA